MALPLCIEDRLPLPVQPLCLEAPLELAGPAAVPPEEGGVLPEEATEVLPGDAEVGPDPEVVAKDEGALPGEPDHVLEPRGR